MEKSKETIFIKLNDFNCYFRDKLKIKEVELIIERRDDTITANINPIYCFNSTLSFHVVNGINTLKNIKGISICSKHDEFNYEYGKKLAIKRWKKQVYGQQIADRNKLIDIIEKEANKIRMMAKVIKA